MAEIIGLAASLITVTSVVNTSLRFAHMVYDITDESGMASTELKCAALNLSTGANCIHLARLSLTNAFRDVEHRQRSGGAQSQVVLYMKERKMLADFAEQCKQLRRLIRRVYRRVKKLMVGGLLARFKWRFGIREEVLKLTPEMEMVKSTLLLILSVMQIELSAHRERENPSEHLRREIEFLETQLKFHIKTIEILQRNHPEATGPEPAKRNDPSGSNLSAQSAAPAAFSDAVLELARSVRDHGTVPGAPTPGSPSGHAPRGTRTRMRRRPDPTRPSENTRTRAARPPVSTPVSRESQSPAAARAPPSSPREASPVPGRSLKRTASLGDGPRESSKLHLSPPSSAVGSLASLPVTPVAPPSPDANSSFLAVHPIQSTLQVHLDGLASMSGYVPDRARPRDSPYRQVTALVDEDLPVSIVSQSFAVRWGLLVDLYFEDGASTALKVQFGDGRRLRCVGGTVLFWHRLARPSQWRPIRVHCEVVEHEVHQLILGRSFLERKDRYWGVGSG